MLQIWQRLGYFKNLKAAARRAGAPPPVVGVLGVHGRAAEAAAAGERPPGGHCGGAGRLPVSLACPRGWRGSLRGEGELSPCHVWWGLPRSQGQPCGSSVLRSRRCPAAAQRPRHLTCAPSLGRPPCAPCRDLPRLIDIVQGGSDSSGQEGATTVGRRGRAAAMNVQLSADET